MVGLYLYLPAPTGLGVLNMWLAMPLIIASTLLVYVLVEYVATGFPLPSLLMGLAASLAGMLLGQFITTRLPPSRRA